MKGRIRPPIKYFGGKGMIIPKITKYFPQKYTHYIEPFGGSFSIGLSLNHKCVEIYNDLDTNIYTLYKVIKDKELFSEFKRLCDLSIYIEKERSEYKKALTDSSLDEITRAFYFFYVSRTSVQGAGGFSANPLIRRGMSKVIAEFLSSIEGLPQLHDRLSSVVIRNKNAIKLLEDSDDKGVFLYCDPPYHHSTRTSARYNVDMDDNQQLEFLDTVNKAKNAKILISGYDNPIYEKHLKNWTKAEFKQITRTAKGDVVSNKEVTETLWYNYELPKKGIFF